MLWGNNAVAVWVTMPGEPPRPGGIRIPWELEAMAWPDEKHPSGKDHLIRVSYLYIQFNGWIRKDRVRPR